MFIILYKWYEKYYDLITFCSIFDSSDEFLTSLVYMDTSVNPNKLLGHVIVNESEEKNAVDLDLGKILFICFFLIQSTKKVY